MELRIHNIESFKPKSPYDRSIASRVGGGSMIIEFFGPPGIGKTTLARVLTARLREQGCAVQPILNYRPVERTMPLDLVGHRSTASVYDLAQLVVDMVATVPRQFANSQEVGIARNLMKAIPPRNIVWSIRAYRYLMLLSRSWCGASLAVDTVLFDQAFVQSVCSLALLSRAVDEKRMALALGFVPKSDLLIRLDAPREILNARLCERRRLQTRTRRLFDLDLKTKLKSVEIIGLLYDLLRKGGRSVTCVDCFDCFDQRSLSDAVERIAREVMAMSRRAPAGY